ncbi:MAG: hypothetical protein HY720_05480 [Planctomycetes bacterium]|nr:hypothetical protein [Planctomycetota bacterium]
MSTPSGSILSDVDERDLIERGSRVRGGNLLEQAGATFEVARLHRDSIEKILPPGTIEEGEAARSVVENGIKRRENVAEESKDAKRLQDTTLKFAREWARRVVALVRMALAAGVLVPEVLTKVGPSWKRVSTSLEAFARNLGLLKENAETLKRFPLYEQVVSEGESIATRLASVDATQEAKRIAELPEAVRRYYVAKGRLLAILRIVMEAGRAAFAGNRAMAKRFSLTILYRRGRKAKGEAPAAGEAPSTGEAQPNSP